MDRPKGHLSRREFLLGAGSATVLAAGAFYATRGRGPSGIPRVGLVLAPGLATYRELFLQGMAEQGYTEGQDFVLEPHRPTRARPPAQVMADAVAGLLELPVDLLVAVGGPAAAAAKRATSSIPIVMANSPLDSVDRGLLASLARSGDNLTGVIGLPAGVISKQLELLTQVVPSVRRVAALGNRDSAALAWREAQAAAQALGLALQSRDVRTRGGLEVAVEATAYEEAPAMHILPDVLTATYHQALGESTARMRLPAIHSQREFVEAGGLMSYGMHTADMFRRVAYYVDRILKGTKPADLPVEQPMRFDFAVNMKTARELGITFPHEVALQITEVIE